MKNWRNLAACRDAPPELFFPIGDTDTAQRREQVARATAICDRCFVRSDCAAFVLEHPQYTGIWAGVDMSEPRARQRRAGREQLRDVAGVR